ncbi:50S ribosomal protein L17 [bacterium]|nr:50S ribosomal protein L17 [candidate division CSSED10-310 bacterium]
MRHRKIKCKLNRTSSHRKAMLRNMTASILEHGRIQTTLAKAKEVRKMVDYVITTAKRDDLHSRRLVIRLIPNRTMVARLFNDIAPRYKERPGGFTRIYRLEPRKGDAAEMAVIELVDLPDTEKE